MSEPSEDFEQAWAAIVAELTADLPDGPADGTPNDVGGTSRPDSPEAGSPAAGSPAAGSPAAGSPAAGSPAVDSPAAGSPAAGTATGGQDRSGPRQAPGASSPDAPPSGPEVPDQESSAGPQPPGRGGSAPIDPALFTRWERGAAAPAPDERPNPAGDFVDNWEDEGHFHPPPPPELPTGTPRTRLAWAGALGGPATLLLSVLTPWDPPSVVTWGAALATLAGFVTLVWSLPESREDGWDDGARL